jgi:uncharacterized membrane protein (Fun14 family)
MSDKDFWVVATTIVGMILAVFIYLNISGYINIDWNSVFNIKTYPK